MLTASYLMGQHWSCLPLDSGFDESLWDLLELKSERYLRFMTMLPSDRDEAHDYILMRPEKSMSFQIGPTTLVLKTVIRFYIWDTVQGRALRSQI